VRRITCVLALCAAYLVVHRRLLTWGATESEASSRLPGDELLEVADGMSTRAVEIDAPPSAVWPWIAQMGPSPRGGVYTYDWIENLMGLNMHSADAVLPDFQHPEVGHTIGFGSNRMRLERGRSRAGARVEIFRRELGVDVRAQSNRSRYEADQPEPVSPTHRRRAHRDGPARARIARDGAQDAARYQTARGAPGRRHVGGATRMTLTGLFALLGGGDDQHRPL
jgi:hypothetical protein